MSATNMRKKVDLDRALLIARGFDVESADLISRAVGDYEKLKADNAALLQRIERAKALLTSQDIYDAVVWGKADAQVRP